MATRTRSEILADVVARVDPNAVAERMVAVFRAEITGYRRLPEPVVINQILAICRDNVELFFGSITDGRAPTEADLARFRESARDRAGEGMPLGDLLHAYRLGGRMGWQSLLDAAEEDERPYLLEGAERLMDYIDRVSSVVAQAYLDERQHLVTEEERRLRDLFEALLRGGSMDAGLRDLADRIGFPLGESYRPFAYALPTGAAYDHAQLAAELRSRGVLALTEGDRVTGLAPPDSPEPDGGEDAIVAVGEPTGRGQLRDALEELRLLVDLGRVLGASGRLEPEAFVAELLVARSPRLGALVRARALGPLEEYAEKRGSDLIDTLETFVACRLDRREAAEQLHVHPNTLDYRLGRVAELTGLDLGRPDDLVLTVLALKQRALLSG